MLEVWIRKLAKEEFFLFFTHSFDNEPLILTEKEEAPWRATSLACFEYALSILLRG